MSKYTPTTNEMRQAIVRTWDAEAFDRWLAAHDAEVREQAAQRVYATLWQWHSDDPEWFWEGCPCANCKFVEVSVAAARGEDGAK